MFNSVVICTHVIDKDSTALLHTILCGASESCCM
uniref:Uncharacterized protein n=1 Tax=Anguilla anguilla TaxID=7936 RepID=A0A0E9PRQ9_ANGAN